MRALLVAVIVFIAALAGCSGKKGEDHDHLTYTCTNGKVISAEDYEGAIADENITVDFLKTKCPKGTGSGTGGNGTGTTNAVPNKLPVLKMNVTDAGGNATMVTMLKGNLTFSAAGSTDSDGTISAIAISVTDSNTTRTKSLYNPVTKTFTPVMFSFDRAGPVNVSVQMVDDRAGFNGSLFKVYVNQMQTVGKAGMSANPSPQLTDPCTGASGSLGDPGPIVDGQYFGTATVTIAAAPSFIEARPATRTQVTICDPDYKPISTPVKSDKPVTTNNGDVPLPLPTSGVKGYSVGMYATTGTPNTAVSVLVIVHYEPRPAAAA